MKAARVRAWRAVLLPLAFLALAPTSVLAFNPPAPGNPGLHIGEYLHNPHLQTAPGGGGLGTGTGSNGTTNASSFQAAAGESTPTISFPVLQLQPGSGGGFSSLTAGFNFGQDSVLVVAILAALIAANVVLGVVYVARGGNFLLKQALRPVPAVA